MKTFLSELADLMSQIVERTPGGLALHLDRHTLSNVGSQLLSLLSA